MPIDISVRADIAGITKALSALAEKQIPFATAMAINDVGKQVQAAERANIKETFPTATPFTVNSVGMIRASKGVPRAIIFVKDIAAGYLEPYEDGGRHMLNSRALLNPKDINLNQYGNIPKGKLASLRGRADVFIGGIKGKGGATVNGVWQRIPAAKGVPATLKLIIRFGDALPVKERLHYRSKAQNIVSRGIGPAFERAMAKAMATARP